MQSKQPTRRTGTSVRLLLLSLASVTGCATPPPATPSLQVVSRQVTIPSPPVVIEPKEPGYHWRQHCELVARAQVTLKTRLAESEACRLLGLLPTDPKPFEP